MRRTAVIALVFLPTLYLLLVAGILLPAQAPAAAAPSAATATPIPSGCLPGLQKWVEPAQIVLGDTCDVTMVMSGTCPSRALPVDLVFLADESTSMTRGKLGPGGDVIPTERATPDPSQPPPTPGPEPTQGRTGDECEPFFCTYNPRYEPSPTPTKTRRWPPVRRTPTPRIVTPVPTPILEEGGTDDQLRAVQSFVREFLQRPEIEKDLASGRLKTGFASFNRSSRIREALTADVSRISTALGRMSGGDITRIKEGVREAERILNGSGARDDGGDFGRIKMVIILSDFQFCQADVRALANDIVVFSVGFGVRSCDRPKMQALASSRGTVSSNHNVGDVVQMYLDATSSIHGRAVGMGPITVRDTLTDTMELIPGSLSPPTGTVNGPLIEWSLGASMPVTVGYTVRPLEGGRQPVSRQAVARWTDTEGFPGEAAFPDVSIDVLVVTPTPSPTSTPSPTITLTPTPTDTPTPTFTPTPVPQPAYLPVLVRTWFVGPAPTPTPEPTKCIPSAQTVDIALVMDTSTSMGEPTRAGGLPKLTAAIQAASALVEQLKAEDQVAVIAFNNQAYVLSTLTADKTAVVAALQELPSTTAVGTGIHRGMQAGLAELTGPRLRKGSTRAMVLVTDGRQSDEDGVEVVRETGRHLRAANITLVTIGLGSDVDAALLQEVATRPEYYYPVPNAEDLIGIYRLIAQYIPCG